MAECMEKSRDCWGEIAVYSFDIDLPNVTLCKGHVWALAQGQPLHERVRIAEEIEDLSDDR